MTTIRSEYRRPIGTTAALVALLLAGIGPAAAQGAVSSAAPTQVRAVYIPVVTWLPAWVAKDEGLFVKHGLEVSLMATQNLSVLPGTVGRQFDIVPSTPPDLIKAVANGIDVVAVAGEAIETARHPTTDVMVRKDSGIADAKDLKGKVIATPTMGGVIHVSVLYWLKQNGVDPNSIRTVEVPFPNMADQLKAGRVDAVEALEPFVGQLRASGNLALGDPLLSVGDHVLFPFWISQGAWARTHGKVIAAWIAALQDARSFIEEKPAETRAILAKYSGLSEAVVQKVPYPEYSFTIRPGELDVWVKVLLGLGLIDKPIDEARLVTAAK